MNDDRRVQFITLMILLNILIIIYNKSASVINDLTVLTNTGYIALNICMLHLMTVTILHRCHMNSHICSPVFLVCVCGKSRDCYRGPVSQNLPRGLSERNAHPGHVGGLFPPGSDNVDRGTDFFPCLLMNICSWPLQSLCNKDHLHDFSAK